MLQNVRLKKEPTCNRWGKLTANAATIQICMCEPERNERGALDLSMLVFLESFTASREIGICVMWWAICTCGVPFEDCLEMSSVPLIKMALWWGGGLWFHVLLVLVLNSIPLYLFRCTGVKLFPNACCGWWNGLRKYQFNMGQF